MSCIKNYIIVSDMHHSISLLLWREEDASLNLISRDYDRGVYPSTQIIYDNSKLAILTGDDFGNLRLLQEDPR